MVMLLGYPPSIYLWSIYCDILSRSPDLDKLGLSSKYWLSEGVGSNNNNNLLRSSTLSHYLNDGNNNNSEDDISLRSKHLVAASASNINTLMEESSIEDEADYVIKKAIDLLRSTLFLPSNIFAKIIVIFCLERMSSERLSRGMLLLPSQLLNRLEPQQSWRYLG